jgi:predicted  nucleic acid-binding Zn-ribbon protein
MEQTPAGPAQTLDQKVDTLLQRFESFTGWVNERFAKIEGTLAGLAARPGLVESAGESEETKALKAKVTETEGKLNDASKKPEEAQQNPEPQQEPADIVNLRKELVEAQSKLADAEKKTKAEKDRFTRFHEAVKDALPNRETELRWLGTGPKLFAERVKHVLHEFQSS